MKITFFLCCIMALSCTKLSKSSLESSTPNSLFNCWKHNFEVNAEYMVFNPCDSREWRIARYRSVMELYSDGNCKYYFLAPNDGHYFVDGTYEFIASTNRLKLMLKNGVKYEFLVKKLETDEMDLIPIN